MTNEDDMCREDQAVCIYAEDHRWLTIDTKSLPPTGVLILPGRPPLPRPLYADDPATAQRLREYWTTGPGSMPPPPGIFDVGYSTPDDEPPTPQPLLVDADALRSALGYLTKIAQAVTTAVTRTEAPQVNVNLTSETRDALGKALALLVDALVDSPRLKP